MNVRNAIRRFTFGAVAMLVIAEVVARLALSASGAPVLRWHDYGSQLKVEQMESSARADLVIVGTSMAQQDLVPQHLAAPLSDSTLAYNAGLNGGVPQVMEPWLLDQVLDRLNPSIVVWGLSSLDFSAVYGDATHEAYDAALQTRPGLLARFEQGIAPISRLVSARTVLRDPASLMGSTRDENRQDLHQARNDLGADGERIRFDQAIGADRAAEVRGRITRYVLDRDDLAAIARTVEELKERGIVVVFVELPVPPRFTSLYAEGPERHQVVGATLDALGEELDVSVLRSASEFSDADFVDFTHLGAVAAQGFSDEIGRQLAPLVE